MSVSSIIDPTTGKIYDDLIGQGGGVSLEKGQIITAIANQTEVPSLMFHQQTEVFSLMTQQLIQD